MNESDLILGVVGLPPESSRNCVQELYPVPNGEFRKSVNGDILFLESTERKKYKSIISCKDVNTPIIDGIWIGSQITVGCIQNLWQSINPGEIRIKLVRPAVTGSICVVDKFGDSLKFHASDNEVTLTQVHGNKVFVGFRPWLIMKVINFSMETNEWGMTGGWKLVLEEI
jgi:hypothetical protein